LKNNKCEFALAFMYRTVSNDISSIMGDTPYDIICFFTPSGVKSLFDNIPEYKQAETMVGAFGNNTSKAVEDAGLTLEIKAPAPQAPSMVAALEHFLAASKKK
jgi:uroporphyrinogen-III synthase